MEKTTKEEVRRILFDYVLAVTRHSELTNEEAFEKAYSALDTLYAEVPTDAEEGPREFKPPVKRQSFSPSNMVSGKPPLGGTK